MKSSAHLVALALLLVASSPSLQAAELQSVGALEFGPEDTLFVADSRGAAIHAIETGLPSEASSGEMEGVRDLDAKLAAMLGVDVREVFIKDLAVHQPSGTTVLSIMRGSGESTSPVLMTVSGSGDLGELKLDGLEVTRLDIANAPDPEAMMGRRRKARSYTVTDLEFIDGKLYIAGLSNEEFASTLRRAAFPFDGEVETTGLEIYHGAHGKWETHAPIFTFMQYELNGKPHVVASYLCTPLVTFPVERLENGTKLRGKTIAELGFGNIPVDMISYEHEGERYILLSNTNRGTMKFKASDLEAANASEGISSEVGKDEIVKGAPYIGSPLGHVVQMATFDDDNILVLFRAAENGALMLGPRSKQWL